MLNMITHIDNTSPLHGKVFVGERLIAINEHKIEDVLDYRFYSYDGELTLTVEDENKILRQVPVHKRYGRDLGLDFEEYLMDNPRACSNKCSFCFVDQLPRGMRPTLYFKDDDARLSFLTGSYITLTNLSEREVQRICDLKISPINVSVHTTNPELRVEMMGNKKAAFIMERLKKLAAAGIKMDCQIVCCPDYNDKAELMRSMEDLATLYPSVSSVAIVPVGLTKYRDGLVNLRMFEPDEAGDTIDMVEKFSADCAYKYGSHIFYCSDEMYLKAGREVPPDMYYEDYNQLENGVGLLRLLETEFMLSLEMVEADEGKVSPFTIATGVAASPLINKLLNIAMEKCANIKGNVVTVENDFFGHTIEVAGLITGADLIKNLIGKDIGERLLIPHVMLRDGEGVFLDDIKIEEIERELGVKLFAINNSGDELLSAMLCEDVEI